MMIAVLIVLVILLALFTGGDRTAKSLVTLGANAVILFVSIGIMYAGADPLIVSVITCVLVSAVTIFFQNEFNDKTRTAFISVMGILALMLILIYLFVYEGHLQGFPVTGQNHIRESNGYDGKIGMDMAMVEMAVILMTMVGAVIDTAVAVTSGTYEVARNDPELKGRELFCSGMKIGRDILSSTVNTLFFIFAGEFLIMFINFMMYYSFSVMINSKEFAQGTITIVISAIGCVLAIPAAAAMAGYRYGKKRKHEKRKDERKDQCDEAAGAEKNTL
ncbi:MAG: YibE/F family protein [Eubacteriaceae bacterium]|nr:YibE/F family protein [Eubacteriaceae bacterium]